MSESKLNDANFAQADLAGAKFLRIKDKETLRGLESSQNLQTAIFD